MNPCTVVIPFSTTGILFSINDLYVRFMNDSHTNDVFKNKCTIYQFTRYTLAQFEYKRFLSNRLYDYLVYNDQYPCDYMNHELRSRVKCQHLNFKILIDLLDTYGHFEYNGKEFVTFVPPNNVFSPHNVRLSNLRRTVELLSKEPNKSFEDQNTIPGAQYNSEYILVNPDMIIPDKYGVEEFEKDSAAVMSTFDPSFPINYRKGHPEEFYWSSFSKTGKPLIAMTTHIKANGDYDRIPNALESSEQNPASLIQESPENGNEIRPNLAPVIRKDRCWYSIFRIDESMFKLGVLAYSGVYEDDLVAQWQINTMRHPGNAHQKTHFTWGQSFFRTN